MVHPTILEEIKKLAFSRKIEGLNHLNLLFEISIKFRILKPPKLQYITLTIFENILMLFNI